MGADDVSRRAGRRGAVAPLHRWDSRRSAVAGSAGWTADGDSHPNRLNRGGSAILLPIPSSLLYEARRTAAWSGMEREPPPP